MTNDNNAKGTIWKQWMVAILANATSFTYGLQAGWISPVMKILQSDASPTGTPMTDNEVSWVASVMCLSAVIGVHLYSYMADAYGRKFCLIAIAIPQAISWLILLTATSTTSLILARILCGATGGSCFNIIPMYVKEISQDNIRGLLGSLLILFQNLGILCMYALGSYLDYDTTIWVVLGLPIVTAALLTRAPESPSYLVKIGKNEEAISTLSFLRGLPRDDKSILDEMSAIQAEDMYFKTLSNISFVKIFQTKPWRRALLLILCLISVQAGNGAFYILNYAASLLEKLDVTLSPELQTLSFPLFMLIGSFICICVVNRFGRKVIFIVTLLSTSIAHICLGSSLLLLHNHSVPSWIPVCAILVVLTSYSLGVTPMPYIVMSEIFNFQIRAKVLGLIVSYGWAISFVQLSVFAPIAKLLGHHFAFYIFSGINLIGVFLAITFLPETKGKTVEEIELAICGRNKINISDS